MTRVDEDGCWQAAAEPRPAEVDQAAAASYARRLETVESERAAYRAGVTSTWTAARARAIKVQKAKEKAWWDNLSPAARADRVVQKRLEFDQMSLSQQAAFKARLAERRIHADLDEFENYQTWLRGLQPDEYLARSLERKERFQDLSSAERGASIAAWDQHRLRYGLTIQQFATRVGQRLSTPRREHAALLPGGSVGRDAAFLKHHGLLFDEAGQQATG